MLKAYIAARLFLAMSFHALFSVALLTAQTSQPDAGATKMSGGVSIKSKLTKEDEVEIDRLEKHAYELYAEGKHAESVQEHREVVKINGRILGEEHFNTLDSRMQLAGAFLSQQNYTGSEQEHREVLKIFERVQGPAGSRTLYSREQLAEALSYHAKNAKARGNSDESRQTYEEAEQEYRTIYKIREHASGSEHPDTLDSRHHLAVILLDQEKYAAAEQEEREVLKGRERAQGKESQFALWSHSFLAKTLSEQGKNVEAVQECRTAWEISGRLEGWEKEATLQYQDSLAWALQGQRISAEAEREFRAVLKIRERVLGVENPTTLSSRFSLACALLAQGKLPEAEQEFRILLKLQERLLGTRHSDTWGSRGHLIILLQAQGKNAEAEQMHRAQMKIDGRDLHKEKPDAKRAEGFVFGSTVENYESRYQWHLSMSVETLLEEGLTFAQQAEKECIKVYGLNHKDTVEAVRVREQVEAAMKSMKSSFR